MLKLFGWPRRQVDTTQELTELPLGLPWLSGLDAERQQRLRQLSGTLLRSKTITPVQGLELSPEQHQQLATLLCLPLLEFGAEGLHGWSEIIVYPGAFRVQRQHHDETTGVTAEWDDELIGESWERGPLILSWDDILADIADPTAGFNLAVHEMAHKLDALDGVMDGTPPLPVAWQREWAQDFQLAYDEFCASLDAGHDSPIDAYAAEAPEEFFAVTSEYHFSNPTLLQQTMPRIADHLRRFYGSIALF